MTIHNFHWLLECESYSEYLLIYCSEVDANRYYHVVNHGRKKANLPLYAMNRVDTMNPLPQDKPIMIVDFSN